MKQLDFKYTDSSLASKIDTLDLKVLDINLEDHLDKEYEHNIKTINDLVKKKKKLNPTVLIVIGIGGSNLGTIAIHEAINGKFYNLNSQNLKVYFVDTVDSDYISNIYNLTQNELEAGHNIIINLISKSGTTTESIANFELFLLLLKKYKPTDFKDYIVITTDKGSFLWNYSREIYCDVLEIPKKVGGRYSVFTPVGLFPLAFLGINIENLLLGAQEAKKEDAAISASLLYYHYQNGINIHDTFLFAVDLESLGKWYRQLMAESIGKDGKGITPTVSIGSIDLHSIVQLNLAGPIDKFTTFVSIENNFTNLQVPQFDEFEEVVSNIQGLEFFKLMESIIIGTKEAYKLKERPFSEIILKDKSEKSIGNFLQFKMFEIIYLAHLLKVNPFDQPDVEIYKQQTRNLLKERV